MSVKKYPNLSKLTLVMPTCRRQDFVLRNIEYWSKTDVKIIILDDSPKSIENEIINKFNKNIKYIHCQKSYSDRLEIATNEIKTKYVQLICDDEFYIISALESCLDELENDDTLISCNGCCLKFNYEKKNNSVYSNIVYEPLSYKYNYTMISDPIDRISNFMENYIPFLMYGIVRSEIWKKAFSIPSKRKFNFFAYEEYQINIFLSLVGKSKVLRELSWLRSSGETLPTREKFIDKKQPPVLFDNWWDQNYEEKKIFLQIMSKVFQELNPEIITDYHAILNRAFNHYIRGGGANLIKKKIYFEKKNKGILMFNLITAFIYIKKIIPKKIKNFIKSTDYYIKLEKTFNESAIVLNKRGVKVDLDKLNEINKVIKNFHFK